MKNERFYYLFLDGAGTHPPRCSFSDLKGIGYTFPTKNLELLLQRTSIYESASRSANFDADYDVSLSLGTHKTGTVDFCFNIDDQTA